MYPVVNYRLKQRATVRTGPSRLSPPIARLPKGREFEGRALADWIEIVKDGQSAGFVHGRYVEVALQERAVGE